MKVNPNLVRVTRGLVLNLEFSWRDGAITLVAYLIGLAIIVSAISALMPLTAP